MIHSYKKMYKDNSYHIVILLIDPSYEMVDSIYVTT